MAFSSRGLLPRTLKYAAWTVALMVGAWLIVDEMRVRAANETDLRAWEVQSSEALAKATGMTLLPAKAGRAPDLVSRVGSPFASATSSGGQAVYLVMRSIDRTSQTYREDAHRLYEEAFSADDRERFSYWFSAESRSAMLQGVTVDPDGRRRFWYVEMKRLGGRVLFAFLDKGSEEKAVAEVGVSRFMAAMLSQSDDPGGLTFVECSTCGKAVRRLDDGFPAYWAVLDAATEKPVPTGTPLGSAHLAPVCAECARRLGPTFVHDGGPAAMPATAPPSETTAWSRHGWESLRWGMTRHEALSRLSVDSVGETWRLAEAEKARLGLATESVHVALPSEPVNGHKTAAVLKFDGRGRLFAVLVVTPRDGEGLSASECLVRYEGLRRVLASRFGRGKTGTSYLTNTPRTEWSNERLQLKLTLHPNDEGCFLHMSYVDPGFTTGR